MRTLSLSGADVWYISPECPICGAYTDYAGKCPNDAYEFLCLECGEIMYVYASTHDVSEVNTEA